MCTFVLLFVLAAVVVDSAKEEEMWKDLLLEAGKCVSRKTINEIELILLKIRNLNRFSSLR